jgi:hypothetical protein
VLSTALTSTRRLWLFDSFEGLLDVQAIDGPDAREWVGKCKGTVVEALTSVGASPDRIKNSCGAAWQRDGSAKRKPAHNSVLN